MFLRGNIFNQQSSPGLRWQLNNPLTEQPESYNKDLWVKKKAKVSLPSGRASWVWDLSCDRPELWSSPDWEREDRDKVTTDCERENKKEKTHTEEKVLCKHK